MTSPTRSRWSWAFLAACTVLVPVTGLGGLNVLAFAVWTIAATAFFAARFGLLSLWNPAIMLWWLGFVPAAVAVILYGLGFIVGLPVIDYPSEFIWSLGLTSIVWALQIVAAREERGFVLPAPANIAPGFIARLQLMGYVACGLSIVASAALFIKNGSAYFAVDPEAERVVDASGNGLLGTLEFTALAVGIVAILLPRLMARPVRAAALVIPSVVVAVGLVGLFATGTRVHLIHMAVIIFVVVCVALWSRLRLAPTVIVAAALLVVAAGIGFIRSPGAIGNAISTFVHRLESDVYVAGQIFTLAVKQGMWGGQAVLLSFGVYRPGHDPALGDVLKTKLGLTFSGGGVTTPIPAEGFLDFGWGGVIAYGLVAGLIVAGLTRVFPRQGIPRLVVLLAVGVTASGLLGGLGVTTALFILPQAAACAGLIVLFRLWNQSDDLGWNPRRFRHASDEI